MARQKLSALVGKDADSDQETTPAGESTTTAAKPAPTATPAATSVKAAEPAESRPAAPETAAAAVEPRKPRAPRRTQHREAGDDDRETASKGVPVHLTEELNERLQAYMSRKRWSHQTVLLDAIEATYTRLPELIRAATAADDETTERTPLFDRPSRPAPKATGEARVKHTVRMSDSNRNTLDHITEVLGAPSRNFVITVAYEAYLPPIEKS
jgi:predicted DNA-binding protein